MLTLRTSRFCGWVLFLGMLDLYPLTLTILLTIYIVMQFRRRPYRVAC